MKSLQSKYLLSKNTEGNFDQLVNYTYRTV